MTTADIPPLDRSALVYRHHERLYRLALLVAGDAGAAAALVQQAYRQVPEMAPDPEALLTRALLAGRPGRQRWRLATSDADLARATLGRPQAAALLDALARLTPAARLIIGLYYVSGREPGEIAALLGSAVGDQPPAEVLAHFRAEAARAVELVPAGADTQTLLRLDRWAEGGLAEEEATALRRDIFEQPDLRALRDGVIAARDLLPRAIPALFAAMPPLDLTDRLLKIVQGRRRAGPPRVSTRWAQGLLALGVLVLAAAIILVPSLVSRGAPPATLRTPPVADLIDGAIHRFDRAPLQQGVLHEQYRVAAGDQPAYLIDRWYDYATPNRLAIGVRADGRNGPPLLQIGTDGRSIVQIRRRYDGRGGRNATDAHVSEAEAQSVLPLLRGQPATSRFGREGAEPDDPGPLFLAQARSSNASFLGRTTALGRPAFLLSYQTTQPPLSPAPADQPVKVVLTIDAQTYSLLDVALLSQGAAEGTARHPVQAQQFEVLRDVPAARFQLPSSPDVAQRADIASVRFPFIGDEQLLTLEDAARRTTSLLAPSQLPDAQMRGLAIAIDRGAGRNANAIALLYEGEFQDVLVLPSAQARAGADAGEERSAGDFRYRIVRDAGFDGGIMAAIYRPDAPEQRMLMILNDDFASAAEREATLQSLIASLTPVDTQTLPVLQRNFHTPSEAAGKSP